MALIEDKLYKRIKNGVGRAIADFGLIGEGDRIAVAVSGGKDSYALLHILEALRKRAPVKYELVAINIDSGYPGYRADIIEEHLKEHGFTHHMEKTNHYEVIREKRRPDSSYCSFCARLKRGVLYTLAQRFGCNKLALGHHLDDFVETLLRQRGDDGDPAARLRGRAGNNPVFPRQPLSRGLLLLPGLRGCRPAAQADEATALRTGAGEPVRQAEPAKGLGQCPPPPPS